MNKQSIFYLELLAEKQVYEEMIESSKKNYKADLYLEDFFRLEVAKYENKLEVINLVIEKYLKS